MEIKKHTSAVRKHRGRLFLHKRRNLPSRYHRANRSKAPPYTARIPKPKNQVPQRKVEPATETLTHSFYQPLDASRLEIRLIRILPAKSNDETIRCEIETAYLSTGSLEFAAISYVWGDLRVTRQISINNEPFYITENLHDAFRQFRSNTDLLSDGRNSMLPLWADAICINQDDISERNQQVQFMGIVFGSAALVISWLGVPGEGKGDIAVHILKRIVDAAFEDGSENINEEGLSNFLDSVRRTSWEDEDTSVPMSFMTRHSIQKLFWRPYWRRIWIVQEIVLVGATSTHLCVCGNESIKFEEVMKSVQAIEFLLTYNDPGAIALGLSTPCQVRSVDTLIGIELIIMTREFYREPHKVNIFFALVLSLSHHATDAKDMIYGLQALTCSKIIIDYNKTVKEIYLDWYNAVISAGNTEACVVLLYYSGLGLHEPGEFDLPSWLPNLSRLHEIDFPFLERHFLPSDLGLPSFPSSRVLDNVLHVSGVRACGKIVRVFGPIPVNIMGLHKLCSEVLIGNNAEGYPTGISILQALFCVLLRGYDPATGQRLAIPLDSVEAFEAFHFYACANIELRLGDHVRDEDEVHEYCTRKYEPIWEQFGIDSWQELESILESNLCKDMEPKPNLLPYTGHKNFQWWYIGKVHPMRGVRELKDALDTCQGMAIFQTVEGYIGLGPWGLKAGDQACTFGRGAPSLLREYGKAYKNVGGCYIYGVSEGEVIDMMEPGDPRIERFEIY
ncbi:heterokaryon incompatibility protein-domain-containing protein [Hypomontagnella monticulosa]|nr:heterokaryon incompatibility protein-domain-containing protein [Hypomontagnella monticulosa]